MVYSDKLGFTGVPGFVANIFFSPLYIFLTLFKGLEFFSDFEHLLQESKGTQIPPPFLVLPFFVLPFLDLPFFILVTLGFLEFNLFFLTLFFTLFLTFFSSVTFF